MATRANRSGPISPGQLFNEAQRCEAWDEHINSLLDCLATLNGNWRSNLWNGGKALIRRTAKVLACADKISPIFLLLNYTAKCVGWRTVIFLPFFASQPVDVKSSA